MEQGPGGVFDDAEQFALGEEVAPAEALAEDGEVAEGVAPELDAYCISLRFIECEFTDRRQEAGKHRVRNKSRTDLRSGHIR